MVHCVEFMLRYCVLKSEELINRDRLDNAAPEAPADLRLFACAISCNGMKQLRIDCWRVERNGAAALYDRQTVPNEETALQFLRGKGLLHSDRLCLSCGQAMRLGCGGMTWRCHKRSCQKELSIRKGTWFDEPPARDEIPEGGGVRVLLESTVDDG
ncbi:hypothetical protein TTRE_0000959901 [Trichuris trichiura]|uniref:Uncharacterized protein n=1 Tax=Trichuris trichiura TaxID=36087 RepID=A0A077ZN17_TRITR|nr:hypothetical protein TTRE_0000959901 [Trichuris trichiura]